jgi:hypothetical protein
MTNLELKEKIINILVQFYEDSKLPVSKEKADFIKAWHCSRIIDIINQQKCLSDSQED